MEIAHDYFLLHSAQACLILDLRANEAGLL